MRASFIIFVLFVYVGVSQAETKKKRQLPDFVQVCKRDDPELDKCFISSLNSLRTRLADGIPELLLPKMEPLTLPEATFKDSGFMAKFSDLVVDYITEGTVENVKIDLNNSQINLDLVLPRLRIRSNYSMHGRILILSLKGSGPADGNFTDIVAKVELTGTTQNGYLYFEDNRMDIKIGDGQLSFDKLFADDELNLAANKIINDNSIEIINELKPLIDASVADFVLHLTRNVFSAFTIDQLFPIHIKLGFFTRHNCIIQIIYLTCYYSLTSAMKTILIASLFVASAFAADLPNFIKPCNGDSTNLLQCVRDNIEACKPRLAKGIPKLFIPPMNPFKVSEAAIEQSQFKLAIKDVTIHGFDKFDVKDLQIDLKNDKIEMDIVFPHIDASGVYEINGKLLVLTLNGKGPLNCNATNMGAKFVADFERYEREGKTYLKKKDLNVVVYIKDAWIKLDNLFQNNKELTENTNRVINDNILDFFQEIHPIFEVIFNNVLGNVLFKITETYPYEDILPNIN
ncbi:PREDICTED: uncharacterized protein LOC108565822 [Nicrophorus vespilloides]|uniref:Uncharacterized protein LOC108565822 n=1 Tax=Nicrophorus vespilloides TaxID=110193 RepID=A0ABM1N2A7_NICVS|nr:PREDICTED: uncharacterized protein LOC108565822 [Nicrophorus vespilloides]